MLENITPPLPHSLNDPPLAFHFVVSFLGIGGKPAPNPIDIRFQRVSGIGVDMSTKKYEVENGQNIDTPNGVSYRNIHMERGLITGPSPLRIEMMLSFQKMKVRPRSVIVSVLNRDQVPRASWLFFKAYPVSWSMGDLDANRNEVVIERLELTYEHFKTLSL